MAIVATVAPQKPYQVMLGRLSALSPKHSLGTDSPLLPKEEVAMALQVTYRSDVQ
jgi:hypothetical protein